jgi:YVTN family beta-propeller protein
MKTVTRHDPSKTSTGISAILMSIAACSALGCSDTSNNLSCGRGTVREGDVCVASSIAGSGGGSAGTAGRTAMRDSGAGKSAARDAGALDPDRDTYEASTEFSVRDASSVDTNMGDSSVSDAAADANVGVSAETLVRISGSLREIVIDPSNAHIYLSNASLNQIEDYSLAASALQSPILVGSKPIGFDITPDGQHLYVANSGGSNISVVDLSTNQETKKIGVMPGFSSDTPLSLAIANNGKAFFSTTFAGSGFGGRMMKLDLATEQVSLMSGFFSDGQTTEATFLKASADRSAMVAVAGDISSAPVFVYRVATDTFGPEHDLNGFVNHAVMNSDATRVLVDGSFVLDGSLNLLGTISGGASYAVFAPSDDVAYRASSDAIDIVSPSRFLVTGSIPIRSDTMTPSGNSNGSSIGDLAVSSDGAWLAIITDHGIVVRELR